MSRESDIVGAPPKRGVASSVGPKTLNFDSNLEARTLFQHFAVHPLADGGLVMHSANVAGIVDVQL